MPRFDFQYRMKTVETPQGKPLPVSTGLPNGLDNHWEVVPWNEMELNPNDPLNTVSLNNGWSFLYGPCRAIVTTHVRLKNVQPMCSTHSRLYKARIIEGVDTRVWGSEAPEHMVLPMESANSNTHLAATFHVAVEEGERLRLEVDYWNATDPDRQIGRIVGARVQGMYWR